MMSKHKARQTTRIFQAALQLIADEGINHLSMSNIAEAAGVTRQTIYNYFPDVESILAEAMNEHGQAMAHHVIDAMHSQDTARDKLTVFAAFYIDAASPEHTGILTDAGMSPRTRKMLEAHSNNIKSVLRDIITASSDAGELQLACDSQVAVDLIWDLVEGTARTAATHPDHKSFLLNAVVSAIWSILNG